MASHNRCTLVEPLDLALMNSGPWAGRLRRGRPSASKSTDVRKQRPRDNASIPLEKNHDSKHMLSDRNACWRSGIRQRPAPAGVGTACSSCQRKCQNRAHNLNRECRENGCPEQECKYEATHRFRPCVESGGNTDDCAQEVRALLAACVHEHCDKGLPCTKRCKAAAATQSIDHEGKCEK